MSERHLEDLQEMEREAQSRHEKDAARIAALEAEIKRLRADKHNRWVTLRATSNSGKTLFSCKCCGRVSPTPSKECRTFADPEERWACSAWLPDMDPLDKQEASSDE